MRWNQDLFKKALDFAARAHGAQQVPGSGFPYVVHVTKVATEVLHACHDSSFDQDLAVGCALLHDTVEDAGVTSAQLEAAFGPGVAAGVQALTKDEALPKAERMADSLRRVRLQPREVWLVKLGDRITNLEPPPPAWSMEKRRAYLAEARVILEALRGASPLLEVRFEEKLREYAAHCG
jgi:(p)ppGpp synthase/HD superfamily hydrolase